MKNREIFYKGSIIGAMITLPSLAGFALTWHFTGEILAAAGVGVAIHVAALFASLKVAKKILIKRPPQEG